ncbi:GTP-binding protein [Ensifer sesbaniae]|uniref:GTP-binding protein n=1 Tax=Ensifer sesbaniae TaxID=1214071 RepID=UPI0015684C7C|nr:GTP-binding protein [Ensifer sesbaniae]MCK3781040.1 GTP-binding protein [Ensifer sesbaniae]NRQ12895.1 hypothetical protein [Ensifer sesbaniae]
MDHASTCHYPNCRHEHHHDHSCTFSTWSYETDQSLSLDAFLQVARKLPASVYRAKGVVHSSDDPHHRAVLQVVGKRTDIAIQGEWSARSPRTRIVIIGAPSSLAPHELQAQFDACRATGE